MSRSHRSLLACFYRTESLTLHVPVPLSTCRLSTESTFRHARVDLIPMSFRVCIALCLASHSRSIVLRHPLLAVLLMLLSGIELKLPRTVALSYQFCYTPYRIVSSPPRIIYLSRCARFVSSSPCSLVVSILCRIKFLSHVVCALPCRPPTFLAC